MLGEGGIPSLNFDQLGSLVVATFVLLGLISAVLGVAYLVKILFFPPKKPIREQIVTLDVLDEKLKDIEGRLKTQIGRIEEHESKLEEYKHETRQMLLEAIHKVDLKLAKLDDLSERVESGDLSEYVKKVEFADRLMEFKDFRVYTHTQIHEIRDVLHQLMIKIEVLIALNSRGKPEEMSLTRSNPDFKLPPEASK